MLLFFTRMCVIILLTAAGVCKLALKKFSENTEFSSTSSLSKWKVFFFFVSIISYLLLKYSFLIFEIFCETRE